MKIIQTFTELEQIKANEGERLSCAERDNAKYVVQSSDYTARVGDVTLASGLVGKLQLSNGKYNSLHFAGFQDGIDRASSENIVLSASGSIDLQSSGSQIFSRNYAILLKSNTHIEGDNFVINLVNDGTLYDGLTTNRGSQSQNIKLTGSITINGNNATRPSGGHAVWIERANNVDIQGLTVDESTSFGLRMNRVSEFIIRDFRVTTTLDQAGDDGLHLYDCFNGLVDGAIINTAGDDCFIISAERVGAGNITAKNLVLSSPSGNRGILLNLADLADAMYEIKNINIQAVCNNCADGPAILLSQADFKNINIDIQSEGCKASMIIDLPTIGFGEGSVRNSTFNINSNTDLQQGILINDSGIIENNSISATIYNNGDGFDSVVLRGSKWSGSIMVDNNPNAVKATPLNCIDLFSDNSDLALVVSNADKGLNLRASALENNISIIETNCTTYSIDNASGLAQCMFTGGKIENTVRLVNDNVFSNVKGATFDNVITATTDASGLIDLAHGLVLTPRIVTCSYIGTQTYTVRVSNITTTNVRFGVYDETGVPVVSEAITIAYSVKV